MEGPMEALRYMPKQGKLSLETLPVPKIDKPNQALVRVKSAGLCGTDLHIVQGHFTHLNPDDVTLGHEFSGVVVAVGKEAKDRLKVGDRVGVDPNTYCFACDFCSNGQFNHCPRGGTRSGIGVFKNGGFAEYALVDANLCFKLPDNVSFDQGALCEPLSCTLHGFNRLQKYGNPSPDSRIFILGAGIIGNLWAVTLHHNGLRNITLTEPFEKRRAITRKLLEGTECQVLSPEEAAALLPKTSREADVDGIDILIDCTGYPPALEQALKWMKRGGTVCVYGCAPPGKALNIEPWDLFIKELVIFGAQINPFTYKRSVALASNMADRYLDLDRLGVQIFKLDEYQTALDKLKDGSISKAMFNM